MRKIIDHGMSGDSIKKFLRLSIPGNNVDFIFISVSIGKYAFKNPDHINTLGDGLVISLIY